MTKGRTALPATLVAGQDPYFIAPVETHSQERTPDTADLSTTLLRSSGRDDKGEGGASGHSSCWTGPIFHRPGRDDKGKGRWFRESAGPDRNRFYHLGWAERPMIPLAGRTTLFRWEGL